MKTRPTRFPSSHCVCTATLVAPRVTPWGSRKRTKMRLRAGSKDTVPFPSTKSPKVGVALALICVVTLLAGAAMHVPDVGFVSQIVRVTGRVSPHLRVLTALPPHVSFTPLVADCRNLGELAVPAMPAQRIPDAPDAAAGDTESGTNVGGTPGGGPLTIGSAPAAAAYPAPARSPTTCSPRRSRVTRWHATGYAATSSCFRAMPRQSGAPGPSLRHSCGAGGVSG